MQVLDFMMTAASGWQLPAAVIAFMLAGMSPTAREASMASYEYPAWILGIVLTLDAAYVLVTHWKQGLVPAQASYGMLAALTVAFAIFLIAEIWDGTGSDWGATIIATWLMLAANICLQIAGWSLVAKHVCGLVAAIGAVLMVVAGVGKCLRWLVAWHKENMKGPHYRRH
jgi:hypothetical protein